MAKFRWLESEPKYGIVRGRAVIVNPGDIVATIFHSLGLNHASHLPGPGGRPFTLTDLGTEPIRELFT